MKENSCVGEHIWFWIQSLFRTYFVVYKLPETRYFRQSIWWQSLQCHWTQPENEDNTTNIESILTPDKRCWQSYCRTVLLLPDQPFGFPNANVLLNARVAFQSLSSFFTTRNES
jgi:hypothetical protein